MNPEQAQFRFDHKKLCMERALERCDYDAANIFAAQAAYYWRLVTGTQETEANRNWFPV